MSGVDVKKLPALPIAAAITAWSLLCHGYRFGVVNHGMQLPLMRMIGGDHAFDHDAFMQAVSQTYTTVFFLVVGTVGRVIPLAPLCFVLFVAMRLGTSLLAMRLGRALFRDERAGVVGAVLLASQTLTFAEDMISDVYLTHDTLAQLMGVAMLVLVAEGRVALAFLVGGLMTPVQPLHAAHMVPLLALALLQRVPLRTLVVGGALACLGVFPTVLWMMRAGTMGVKYPPHWIEFARAWFPTHYWPLNWTLYDWILVVTPVLLLVPVWRIANVDDRGFKRLFVLAVVCGLGAGFVCEVWPDPFLVRLHPMRASWVAWLAFVPALGACATSLWRREHAFDRIVAVMIVFTAALSVFGRVPHLLVLVPAVWACALDRHRGAAAVAGLVLAVVVPAAIIASNSFGIEALAGWRAAVLFDAALSLVAATSIAVVAARPIFTKQQLWQGGVASVAIVCTMHAAFVIVVDRVGPTHDFIEVQRWLAAHRPAGENVMVPLSRIGVRAFSNQTPALDFEDGLASYHDPAYIPVLEEKLQAYGWKPGARIHGFSFLDQLDRIDAALTADDIRRIGARLHAPVAVRDKKQPHVALPVLFENKRFVVLDATSP